MQSNFTLEHFHSLSVDNKSNILFHQNNLLTSTVESPKSIAIDTGNLPEIFQLYIDKFLDNLITKSNLLNPNSNIFFDGISDYKEETQSNFTSFFEAYASTLAAFEMLKIFSPHNIFDHTKTETKLNIIKNTFENEVQKFINFYIDDKIFKEYDLKILSIEEIELNAQNLIKQYDGFHIINFMDSTYRNYLRSRSDVPERLEYNEHKHSEFDISIVAIENAFDFSFFAQENLISTIYSAYVDIYKSFRHSLNKGSMFPTFESYKTYRIDVLKRVFRHESNKELLTSKLEALNDIELLEKYKSDQQRYNQRSIHFQGLLQKTYNLLCLIFDIPVDHQSIYLTVDQNKVITSEFNGYKFYAFPDDSVKTTSADAYFAFSLLSTDKLAISIDKMFKKGFEHIRSEIEKQEIILNMKIPTSNFYNQSSMLEELNVHHFQQFFFKNAILKQVNFISN